MRLAPIVILLALAAPAASAKPVMRVDAPWSMCRESPSWNKLQKCLEHFGPVTVERTFERLKVLSVREKSEYTPFSGLYIYAQLGTSLRLVWMSKSASNGNVEILDVKKVSVAGSRGYRLEIGSVEPSAVTLDAQTSLAAVMRRQTATFCLGAEMTCVNAIEQCEVLVDGKAYYTFRGTLAIEEGTAVVSGDRSHAGMCGTVERTPLVAGAR